MKFILHVIALLAFSIQLHAQAKTEESKDKDKEKKEKGIQDVVKACKKIEGLFTFYQDTTNAKVYMQVNSDQLDKEYIHFYHIENGALNAGWVKGNYGRESLFKIKKYFDRLEFVGQNPNFYYDPANPLSRSAEANINEPIINVSKIVAKSEGQDSFLIEARSITTSEAFVQLKRLPSPGSKAKNPFKVGSLSKDKTRIDRIRSYPKNSDWLVTYVFQNQYPTNFGLPTITDARYTSVQVQHSFVEMPVNDFVPRYDDARIGYFTTQVTDQISSSATPYRDMINRWHLKKENPGSALSDPVEPIIFWMENTTPYELRPIIKEAVEDWNIAFEQAGFSNAVVVKQQPDDAEWDAGDLRYNVLRWTSSPYMGSAWGPSFVNPRTGQILGADIMLDYIFVKGRGAFKKLFDMQAKSLDDMMFENNEETENGKNFDHFCLISEHENQNYLFGQTAGKALGYNPSQVRLMNEEMVGHLLLHEVGHTLGLNHNFKASHLWSPSELNNRALTEKKGLIGSVMDYTPFNITGDPKTQGQYKSTVPGPYDKWAIEFGYSEPLAGENEEKKRLGRLLSRSTERELDFGNDADGMQSPGRGIDPTINVWDMSSDVLVFGVERLNVCNKTLANIIETLTEEGKSYEELRDGYYSVMGQQFRALNTIVRYVGGVEIDRAVSGQIGGTQPFTPTKYQTQKKAMSIVLRYAFSPQAFLNSSELYVHLQKQRRGFNHRSSTEDPKIHAQIGGFQRALLAHLLHPTVLLRLSDSGLYGNTYSVNKALTDLTNGIYMADLKTQVNTIRQNLQIEYLQALIRGFNKSGYDHVSKSSMLSEVKRIGKMMKNNKSKDAITKAHREHITFLINKALDLD